jgi:hypothetical protein
MNVIQLRRGVEAPDDGGPGAPCRAVPDSRPASPSDEWLEAARQAFLRRWWDENGDSFEFSRDAYGEKP